MNDLLKLRYKVIAAYPGMKGEGLEVGQIITCREYDNDFSEKLWCQMNDAYPHLFKKLEWFEERNIEEMPEYVKCVRTPDNIHFPPNLFKVTWINVYSGASELGYVFPYTKCYLPATFEEYQNQNK